MHPGHGDSVLADLAWSLACDQHPGRRVDGFDAEVAGLCLARLMRRLDEPLRAFLVKRMPHLWPRAEDVIDQAWSQASLAYWSPAAAARFRGTAACA